VQAQIPEQSAAGQLLSLVSYGQLLTGQRLAVLLDQAVQQGLQAIVLAFQQGFLLGPVARPARGRDGSRAGRVGCTGKDHRMPPLNAITTP
jgi:hypothetical protein